MADIRLQRLGDLLVNYSLEVKKGDRLALMTGSSAAPLVREIVRAATRAGAHVDIFASLPGVQEAYLQEASEEQLQRISPLQRIVIEEYETQLSILAASNTKSLSGIDPARMAVVQQASHELMQTYMKRSAEGALRWSVAMFPTNAYAQDADMALSDFEDFVYSACLLDDEDPVASWKAKAREQERLIAWLQGKRDVHILGQDTDLRLSIENRIFLNDDGKKNMPGGEFFTGRASRTGWWWRRARRMGRTTWIKC